MQEQDQEVEVLFIIHFPSATMNLAMRPCPGLLNPVDRGRVESQPIEIHHSAGALPSEANHDGATLR